MLANSIRTKRRFTAGKNKLQLIKENVRCILNMWFLKWDFQAPSKNCEKRDY